MHWQASFLDKRRNPFNTLVYLLGLVPDNVDRKGPSQIPFVQEQVINLMPHSIRKQTTTARAILEVTGRTAYLSA